MGDSTVSLFDGPSCNGGDGVLDSSRLSVVIIISREDILVSMKQRTELFKLIL